jgi:tetratricopeptide (TPR) repeat protein
VSTVIRIVRTILATLLLIPLQIAAAGPPGQAGPQEKADPPDLGLKSNVTSETARARRLCEQNRFDEAEAAFTALLAPAETLDLDPRAEGIVLNDFGDCYHRAGRLLEAEKLYLRSLAALEQAQEPDRRTAMATASNLTRLYLEMDQVSRAERLLRRFLPRENTFRPATAEEAVLTSELAYILTQRQQFPQAEDLLRNAIATLEGEADSREQTVVAMSNLAVLYAQTGRVADAVAYSRRARQLLDSVPNCSPPTIVRTLGVAAAHALLDESPHEAESLFQEAIRVAESGLSSKDPLLGQILDLYAQFLHQMNRHGKAKRLEKRAAAIREAFRQENLLGHTVEANTLLRQQSNARRQ